LTDTSPPNIRYGTPAGRWVVASAVLGSGIVFLDGTVVNVALPAMRADLDLSVAGLQWTIDAYLVTLSALLLLGGNLADVIGRRRVFVAGLGGFVVASLLCGIAPNAGALIAARALQGAAGAFLVPGSLAIISATFHPDDRGRAIGAWSGLAGVASALGPLVGGWLIDAVSWRLIFFINLPLAAIAIVLALRHLPETRDAEAKRPDVIGAIAVTIGIAGVTYALIEAPHADSLLPWFIGAVGVIGLVAFVLLEQRVREPMLPLVLFRSAQFTGANLTTFAVYAALSGAMFLVVLHLQTSLRYSAIEAGLSLMPITVLMFAFSSRVGQIAQRIGPRWPMTLGPIVAGAGLWMLSPVEPGSTYAAAVFPAVAVFGAGLTITVAPLTAAVLGAADERHFGTASAVNNAVARLAGLIAVAVLPAIAGLESTTAESLASGYPIALRVCAIACAAGGVIAWATIRTHAKVSTPPVASHVQPCNDCLHERAAA
jgi:EmrB/QacA subfamily drug resistance transporter